MAVSRTQRLGRVEGEPPAKTDSGRTGSAPRAEQLEAPVDRGPQGLVAGRPSGCPLRRSRKRSSSRAAMSATLNAFARAAASSMASGSPSSCRHTSATGRRSLVVEDEVRPGRAGPVHEQTAPRRTASIMAGSVSAVAGTGARPGAQASPWTPSRSRRRWRAPAAGAGGDSSPSTSSARLGTGARSCRGPSAPAASARCRPPGCRSPAGPCSRTPRVAATTCGPRPVCMYGGQLHQPGATGEVRSAEQAASTARRLLPTPPTPVTDTRRLRRTETRPRRTLPAATDEAGQQRWYVARRAGSGQLRRLYGAADQAGPGDRRPG